MPPGRAPSRARHAALAVAASGSGRPALDGRGLRAPRNRPAAPRRALGRGSRPQTGSPAARVLPSHFAPPAARRGAVRELWHPRHDLPARPASRSTPQPGDGPRLLVSPAPPHPRPPRRRHLRADRRRGRCLRRASAVATAGRQRLRRPHAARSWPQPLGADGLEATMAAVLLLTVFASVSSTLRRLRDLQRPATGVVRWPGSARRSDSFRRAREQTGDPAAPVSPVPSPGSFAAALFAPHTSSAPATPHLLLAALADTARELSGRRPDSRGPQHDSRRAPTNASSCASAPTPDTPFWTPPETCCPWSPSARTTDGSAGNLSRCRRGSNRPSELDARRAAHPSHRGRGVSRGGSPGPRRTPRAAAGRAGRVSRSPRRA